MVIEARRPRFCVFNAAIISKQGVLPTKIPGLNQHVTRKYAENGSELFALP
jgi:hypothetical protein